MPFELTPLLPYITRDVRGEQGVAGTTPAREEPQTAVSPVPEDAEPR
jgi:hypothetical protein